MAGLALEAGAADAGQPVRGRRRDGAVVGHRQGAHALGAEVDADPGPVTAHVVPASLLAAARRTVPGSMSERITVESAATSRYITQYAMTTPPPPNSG